MLSAFPVPEVVADFTDLGVEVASSDFVALSYLLELLLYELVYSPSCREFPAVVAKSGHAVSWLMSLAARIRLLLVGFLFLSGVLRSRV